MRPELGVYLEALNCVKSVPTKSSPKSFDLYVCRRNLIACHMNGDLISFAKGKNVICPQQSNFLDYIIRYDQNIGIIITTIANLSLITTALLSPSLFILIFKNSIIILIKTIFHCVPSSLLRYQIYSFGIATTITIITTIIAIVALT